MHKTALLDAYKRAQRQKTEILRRGMIEKIHEAISELSKEVHFKSAYIFGSVLKQWFSDESDIDIAFEGLKDKDFFKAMAFLSRYLERDVDVVQLEGHRLRDKIMKEGILLKS